jgi:hypothetical protein
MTLLSDIKLIRTDPTLDLSQQAEKGIHNTQNLAHIYPKSAFESDKAYGTTSNTPGMRKLTQACKRKGWGSGQKGKGCEGHKIIRPFGSNC